MTVGELREQLANYPDSTPVLDVRGYDLHPRHVSETTFDDWARATRDDTGEYVIPGIGIAVAIGRR